MHDLWIWQQTSWPVFTWQEAAVLPRLRRTQHHRGELQGIARLTPDEEAQTLDTLLANILSSSAIEEERVNAQSVRSSLARRLGISEQQPFPTTDRSEGLAAMMMDALNNREQPLSLARLCQWHQWLFPLDEWTIYSLKVGALRGDAPMLVVSGRLDRPVVHFEAPPRAGLEAQLAQFIAWFNRSQHDVLLDPLLRAAISHLWFVTLHPFDDGNGRITRALTDLALSQADSQSVRLHAMSVSILANREGYYRILEQTRKGTTDITDWLCWFLDMLYDSVSEAMRDIERTREKAQFWLIHRDTALAPEQIKILNRLVDGGKEGFSEGISASQYQKVAKVSKATATRHLTDLLEKGCLIKLEGGGRNTRYHLNRATPLKPDPAA